MNETTAPPAASTETQELLGRLRTDYAQRALLLEEIRRGTDRAEKDRILLELCAFRGMQFTEAADALGVVREAVGKRVRPLMKELDLDGLTLMERQRAKVTRPYRTASVDKLLEKLSPEHERAEQRAKAEQARTLREEMLQIMDQLSGAGMSFVAIADALSISVPTLQRLRGKQA